MNDERDQDLPPGFETDAAGAKPPAGQKPRNKAAAKTGAKKAKKKRVSKKGAAGGPEKKAVAKKKRASKATKARRKKPALDTLPPKSLVLTDEHGKASGVLPKHALVLVNRGVITDAAGRPTSVDPRSAERAFLWLVGRRGTPGAGSMVPHQRQALRVVEQLVRAAVIGDEPSCELITRLYEGLRPAGVTPHPEPPEQAEPPPTAPPDQSPANREPPPTAPADEEPADPEPPPTAPAGDEEPAADGEPAADEESAPGAPAD